MAEKVVHRHRIGAMVFKRVSEFVMVHGEPKAILRWIDIAGVRTPIYVELDRGKLRRPIGGSRTLFYKGTTIEPADALDPRPPMRGRRRVHSQPIPGGRRRTDPPARDVRP